MGFLSKLLNGDKDAEKTAKDFINNIFSDNSTQNNTNSGTYLNGKPMNNSSSGRDSYESDMDDSYDETPNHLSYGKKKPTEENQYNYHGNYIEYFESIFNSEFSNYRYEKETVNKTNNTSYTFYLDNDKKLVVELFSQNSSANTLRRECETNKIPYLRFYYNHKGWWNTKSYVINRMKMYL